MQPNMQPNRSKDGEKILEIMGAEVTVGEAGIRIAWMAEW